MLKPRTPSSIVGAALLGCIFLLHMNTASAAFPQLTSESQKLVASDGAASDIFGFKIAIDGDTAIIGALGYDTESGPIGGQGAAYVFVRRDGEAWSEEAQLLASDGEELDQLGVSVAIDGDIAVVGAYMPAGEKTGAAYVFARAPGSAVWNQQAKLTPSDGEGFDYFGIAVAIEGETIAVGAPRADTTGGIDAGAAYVFEGQNGHWKQRAKLTAPDGGPEDLFGSSIEISGGTIAVGAFLDNGRARNTGSVYVFVRDGGGWTLQAHLAAPDGTALDEFGSDVSLEGDTLLVGAPFHPFGTETGAVYVFVRSGSVWSQQAKLIAFDGAPHDQFGTQVELDDETAVVGARWHDAGSGAKSGAAYVLTRERGLWSVQNKLIASDGAAGDELGDSIALDRGTAMAGAIFDDTPAGEDAGSAYVFPLERPGLRLERLPNTKK